MDTMRDRFTDVAIRLLEEDDRVAIVLADIGVSRFDRTTAPERVFNVGIREQLLIGFAGGLTLAGMKPIAHSYAPFLIERPFEQIKLDLSHQGVGAVLVSIGGSFDTAGEGRTHQAPGDVVLMASLPGWEIHVPGHPDEVEEMLLRAVRGDGRAYIRLSEDANRRAYPYGRISQVRHGTEFTVIAVGPMLDPVLDAVEHMDARVLYVSTVTLLDDELSKHLTGTDIVLVEPYLEGTSAALVIKGLDRPVRMLAIGVPNTEHRHYGTGSEHRIAHGLDAPGLRRRIAAFLSRATPAVDTPTDDAPSPAHETRPNDEQPVG